MVSGTVYGDAVDSAVAPDVTRREYKNCATMPRVCLTVEGGGPPGRVAVLTGGSPARPASVALERDVAFLPRITSVKRFGVRRHGRAMVARKAAARRAFAARLKRGFATALQSRH